MVNYKRVVVSLLLLGAAAAAPAAPDCHYDQRQNGTENYRLNIDGVVIAVAPADALLAAASDLDFSDLLDLDDFDSPPKPADSKPPDSKPQDAKPPEGKPDPAKPDLADVSTNEVKQRNGGRQRNKEKAHRLKMRLANILMPLLRKSHHH